MKIDFVGTSDGLVQPSGQNGEGVRRRQGDEVSGAWTDQHIICVPGVKIPVHDSHGKGCQQYGHQEDDDELVAQEVGKDLLLHQGGNHARPPLSPMEQGEPI